MSKREHRRFTAEQKLEILREADLPFVEFTRNCAENRWHARAFALILSVRMHRDSDCRFWSRR
jgi:hypothetical protein